MDVIDDCIANEITTSADYIRLFWHVPGERSVSHVQIFVSVEDIPGRRDEQGRGE